MAVSSSSVSSMTFLVLVDDVLLALVCSSVPPLLEFGRWFLDGIFLFILFSPSLLMGPGPLTMLVVVDFYWVACQVQNLVICLYLFCCGGTVI